MTIPFLLAATVCCAVSGIVQSAAGIGVARAHVVLSGTTHVLSDSDAAGRFAFDAPAGAYVLFVSAAGFAAIASRRVTVREGSVLNVTLEALDASAPRTIGRVVVDGKLLLSRGGVPSQTITRADLEAARCSRSMPSRSYLRRPSRVRRAATRRLRRSWHCAAPTLPRR